MATEILRPIAASQNRIEDESITLHPETTSYIDGYKLVNEEIADDEAGYIELTVNLKPYYFVFSSETFLDNYSKIKSCRIIFRGKAVSLNYSFILAIYRYSEDYSGIQSVASCGAQATSTDWETYYYDITIDDILAAMERPLNDGLTIGFQTSSTATNDKNSTSTCLTQVYLEITYDDGTNETSEVIYLKENETWAQISGVMYQKVNGTWTTTDSSILSDGSRYILNKQI